MIAFSRYSEILFAPTSKRTKNACGMFFLKKILYLSSIKFFSLQTNQTNK